MEAGKDSLRTDDQATVDKQDIDEDGKSEPVPAADFRLEHKYQVWALMKQQMHQKGQADSYSAANKVIASFATVSKRDQISLCDDTLVNSHSIIMLNKLVFIADSSRLSWRF